jgi:ABC-2 type transport system ATP-binding protein
MLRAMSLAVETQGLRRTFGDFVAVDDIDLAVPAGSVFGFLGPNGAGKSTTIKCLTGLLRPTAGSIRILGLDAASQSIEVRRQVGVVPEDLALFERLTGLETLTFVGQAHGLPRALLRERAAELLEVLDLLPAAGKLVADYSHGMRKKLSLAAALLPGPKLLFLDEPFEGIDTVASRLIRSILQRFVERGGTVFLTSHVLEVVERLTDHVAVIHHGRLVAQGPLAELRGGADGAGRSLEDLFLDLVGASERHEGALGWLGS